MTTQVDWNSSSTEEDTYIRDFKPIKRKRLMATVYTGKKILHIAAKPMRWTAREYRRGMRQVEFNNANYDIRECKRCSLRARNFLDLATRDDLCSDHVHLAIYTGRR